MAVRQLREGHTVAIPTTFDGRVMRVLIVDTDALAVEGTGPGARPTVRARLGCLNFNFRARSRGIGRRRVGGR